MPTTIDSTGATDVTTQLQRFMSHVPNGSTILFRAKGMYRIEGTLHLKNRRNLTIDGNGATTFATTTGDRNRGQWRFLGGHHLVIRNLTVQGANPNAGTGDTAYKSSLEAQHGFQFSGSRGVELDHVTVTDTYGDFVYLGPRLDGQFALTTNVYIHDCTFERNGRQGISFTGASHVLFEHNYIGQTRRATFDMEPNGHGWAVRYIAIQHNQIGPGRLLFVAAHGVYGVNHITVSDNQLNGKAMNISVKPPEGRPRRHDWIVQDNTSNKIFGNDGGAVITFARVDNALVTDNSEPVDDGRNMAGVRARESCNVAVRRNNFPGTVRQRRIYPYDGCSTR